MPWHDSSPTPAFPQGHSLGGTEVEAMAEQDVLKEANEIKKQWGPEARKLPELNFCAAHPLQSKSVDLCVRPWTCCQS